MKNVLLLLGLLLCTVSVQAQTVNLLECTVQNTLTAEPAGSNCPYGGTRQRCQASTGPATDTYFCFQQTGDIVDATGAVVPGSRPGRRHEPTYEDSGWDVLVWSAADGAYWPVDPFTGAVWPEYGNNVAYAQNVWHLGYDCTGPTYVANGSDNRVVWDAYGVAYKAGTEVVTPSSWASCSVDTGWWCWSQTCPGAMVEAEPATNPPSLSGFVAPFRAAPR